VGTFAGLPSITARIYILVQWPQLVRCVSIWFLSGVQLVSYGPILFGGSPVGLVTPYSARPYRCGMTASGQPPQKRGSGSLCRLGANN
jgi:hypothetical protein